jgi:hypothetical protein
MDDSTTRQDLVQIFLVMSWCLALIIFFHFTDLTAIGFDVLSPGQRARIEQSVLTQLDSGSTMNPRLSVTQHFVKLSKLDSMVILDENWACQLRVDPKNLTNTHWSQYQDLHDMVKVVDIESGFDTRFYDMLPMGASAIHSPLCWIVQHSIGILLIAVTVLGLTLIFVWTKRGFITRWVPHIQVFSICFIAILQAVAISTLGGLVTCPLGIAAGAISPVLFVQAYVSSKENKSRVQSKALLWLPLATYTISHFLAEVVYKQTGSAASHMFLQNHYSVSYYVLLLVASGLGFLSIFNKVSRTQVAQK